MWPTFDLVNRGVFMELGSLRLIEGVPGSKGVKNGVISKVYEGKRQEKKGEKGEERKRKGKRKRKEEKEKDEGFFRSRGECSLSF